MTRLSWGGSLAMLMYIEIPESSQSSASIVGNEGPTVRELSGA